MPEKRGESRSEQSLSSVCKEFQNNIKHPEIFLSVQPKKEDNFKKITKGLYDISIKSQDEHKTNPNVLPELILDSMDEEQIWQQLELRNNHIMNKLLQETSWLLSLNKNALSFQYQTKQDDSDYDSEELNESTNLQNTESSHTDEDELDSGSQSEENVKEKVSVKKKQERPGKKSIVDDQFFKLSEMEEFLKAEDEKEMLKQKGKVNRNNLDGGIDYFQDQKSDDEDEEEGPRYGDFFDEDNSEKQSSKRLTKRKYSEDFEEEDLSDDDDEAADEPSEDRESEEDGKSQMNDVDEAKKAGESSDDDEKDDLDRNHPKSSFEERLERLRQRIQEQEEVALGEKPWQLKGEISATTRPKNSLLEEILEFDSSTRPAPVITEETTLRLEDIIRQRIKDKAWDDVERKFKPVATPQEFRKKLVLDQEKSKESLAQVYEKEFQNQLEKLNPRETDEKAEEPGSYKEIRKLMRSLFMKLDALSNFHYTPKPAIPELRIITNTPAIEVEEVAPVAVSSAKLLAPEEIRDRAKGDVLGKNERERTDKNRERRKKKLKQKIVAKAKEQKLEAKQKMGGTLTTKEEKTKQMKNVMKHRNVEKMNTSGVESSAIKSSKAFFTHLQDKTSSKKDLKVKKKVPKEQVSAKRLKL